MLVYVLERYGTGLLNFLLKWKKTFNNVFILEIIIHEFAFKRNLRKSVFVSVEFFLKEIFFFPKIWSMEFTNWKDDHWKNFACLIIYYWKEIYF